MKLNLFKEYRGLRKELYILFLGRIMTNLGSMIWPILTIILSTKLGMDAKMISVVLLIYTFIGLPVNLLGGKLADKFNKRNIIIICDAISIVGYIICACIPMNFGSICVFGAAALFQMMENSSYEALVADLTTSKDRERAYSLSYLGANLGLMLAPTIGGLLVNDYLYVAFILNAVAIASSTILIFLFIKNVDKEKDDDQESEYQTSLEGKSGTLKYLFKNKVVLTFIIVGSVLGSVYGMYQYILPLDLTKIYAEQGSIIYGTLSSVNCIIVVLLTPLITRLFKRINELGKYTIGEILIAGGYIIFLFLLKLPVFAYVGIIIFTIGEIFSTISTSPFLTKRIPASHRGRILAIYNVIYCILSSCFNLGVGAVYDITESYVSWTIIIATSAIGILGIFLIYKLDKKYYRNLQYGIHEENGHIISIKTMTLPLLYDYFKGFCTDPELYLDSSQYKTFEYSDEWVEKYWSKINIPSRKNFLIMYDGTPIGEIDLKHIDKVNKTAELSIHMQNDTVKNKGYGTIAEKILIRYAFHKFNIKEITAKAIPTNSRSIRVLEKSGFSFIKQEGDFAYYSITEK